jgi:hypothetical protein
MIIHHTSNSTVLYYMYWGTWHIRLLSVTEEQDFSPQIPTESNIRLLSVTEEQDFSPQIPTESTDSVDS